MNSAGGVLFHNQRIQNARPTTQQHRSPSAIRREAGTMLKQLPTTGVATSRRAGEGPHGGCEGTLPTVFKSVLYINVHIHEVDMTSCWNM